MRMNPFKVLLKPLIKKATAGNPVIYNFTSKLQRFWVRVKGISIEFYTIFREKKEELH